MSSRITAFVRFWYDFVVGDDWRVAIGVVVALVLTFLLSQTSLPAWWVLPAAVSLLLPATLWRAVPRGPSRPTDNIG
jgi:hypothetical protein